MTEWTNTRKLMVKLIPMSMALVIWLLIWISWKIHANMWGQQKV